MRSTAVYLRVSSLAQDIGAQSIVVRRWLEGHGIDKAEWYIDKAVSGKTLDRPRFIALQEAIFMGEHDTVVMYSLDRFSRTMIEGLVELDKWRKLSVRIVFIQDHLDLAGDNPATDLFIKCMLSMRLAFAEAERERILDRQRAGIMSARQKMERAKELDADGWSLSAIAKTLGTKNSVVQKMLDAPDGKMYWGGGGKGRRKIDKGPQKAWELWTKRKLTMSQIGKIMGVSKPTVHRYIKEMAAQKMETEIG